jgi:hypothetical protein
MILDKSSIFPNSFQRPLLAQALQFQKIERAASPHLFIGKSDGCIPHIIGCNGIDHTAVSVKDLHQLKPASPPPGISLSPKALAAYNWPHALQSTIELYVGNL